MAIVLTQEIACALPISKNRNTEFRQDNAADNEEKKALMSHFPDTVIQGDPQKKSKRVDTLAKKQIFFIVAYINFYTTIQDRSQFLSLHSE
jgi:hypothetical protein